MLQWCMYSVPFFRSQISTNTKNSFSACLRCRSSVTANRCGYWPLWHSQYSVAVQASGPRLISSVYVHSSCPGPPTADSDLWQVSAEVLELLQWWFQQHVRLFISSLSLFTLLLIGWYEMCDLSYHHTAKKRLAVDPIKYGTVLYVRGYFWFTAKCSVCWFVCLSVCLFVCLCRVFLSCLWSDFDQTMTCYMSGSNCVP